ncbi:MAG: hypothetical protein GY835_03450 [bacterium]|nr:hypothetical protein [bacterium]
MIEAESGVPAGTMQLQRAALEDAFGPVSTADADGEHILTSATAGELTVDVTKAGLPGSAVDEVVTISTALNEFYDDILSAEALAGDTEYQCICLKNMDSVTHTLKIWHSNTDTGGAEMSLGLDVAGVGDGSTTGVAATIADEGTAPAGVTFSSPVTEASGLAFVLQSGTAFS